MRSLPRLAALFLLFVSPVLTQQPASSQTTPPGKTIVDPRDLRPGPPVIRFEVLHITGPLDHPVFTDEMSEAQEKWWRKKGQKKYKQMILDPIHPDYVVTWDSGLEYHPGVWFVWHPGTTSQTTVSATATDQNGNRTDLSGHAITTTSGSLEAVPTTRRVTHVFAAVFTWDDTNGVMDGPIWDNNRAGEGWDERGWSQTHPASQQLLDDALKFITSPSQNAEREARDQKAALVALVPKFLELSAAKNLSTSEEAACDIKIWQQIRADKEMLDRVEERNFTDVEKLFQKLCKPASTQR